MSEKRQFLTPLEAIALLPDGDEVHTFRNPGAGMLIGADWKRSEVIKALSESGPNEIEIGGDECQRMEHAIVLWDGDSRPLFIANRPLIAQKESGGQK